MDRQTMVVGDTVWVSERPGEWTGARIGQVVGIAGPRIIQRRDGWVCLVGGRHVGRGSLDDLMRKYG